MAAALASQENPPVAWNGSNWLVMFESYTIARFYYQTSLAFVRVSAAGQPLNIVDPNVKTTISGGTRER